MEFPYGRCKRDAGRIGLREGRTFLLLARFFGISSVFIVPVIPASNIRYHLHGRKTLISEFTGSERCSRIHSLREKVSSKLERPVEVHD